VTCVSFTADFADRLYQFDLNSISVLEDRETNWVSLSVVRPTERCLETEYLH